MIRPDAKTMRWLNLRATAQDGEEFEAMLRRHPDKCYVRGIGWFTVEAVDGGPSLGALGGHFLGEHIPNE